MSDATFKRETREPTSYYVFASRSKDGDQRIYIDARRTKDRPVNFCFTTDESLTVMKSLSVDLARAIANELLAAADAAEDALRERAA